MTKRKRHRRELLPAVRGVAERNAIAEANIPLAIWCVAQMQRVPIVARLGHDDAVGHAMIALIRAAELWNPEKGTKFSTYATRCIRMHLLDAAKHDVPLVHVPFRHWTHSKIPVRWRGNVETIDPLAPPDESASELELGELSAAMDCLDERERCVLHLLFTDNRTLREIGEEMGISGTRVQQLRDRALKKLRRILAA